MDYRDQVINRFSSCLVKTGRLTDLFVSLGFAIPEIFSTQLLDLPCFPRSEILQKKEKIFSPVLARAHARGLYSIVLFRRNSICRLRSLIYYLYNKLKNYHTSILILILILNQKET